MQFYLGLTCVLAGLSATTTGDSVSSSSWLQQKHERSLLDVVTYDANSLMINGERLMIMSGEFHPFRFPSPGLYLDVFHKVKALGFNTACFYVDWALVEGKQGNFSADGVFDLDPFFNAAKEAGLYLIARPGPYINAEASGGGLPGWIQRTRGHIRTSAPDYIFAIKEYLSHIGPIIARAQITNGGPVILVQPENEYSSPEDELSKQYMAQVETSLRDSGIVVPFMNNDGFYYGNFAPGTGLGAVQIYGHDSYPLGYSCAEPYKWSGLPYQYFLTNFSAVHYQESPSTPFALPEFEGGTLDGWGGVGFDYCAIFLNNDFERVFYKNVYAAGVKIINYYMLFGATNWGNLGYPGGYTSYDYGAAIKEDRTLFREKYSELKLQGNFLKVSPEYLIARPENVTNSMYTHNPAISITRLKAQHSSFWVVRHTNFTTFGTTKYKLTLPTTSGKITIPSTGRLSLIGRDSKIMVTDYKMGSEHILYSTFEIFTWQRYKSGTVLVLFGGPEDINEVAFSTPHNAGILEGNILDTRTENDRITVRWQTSSTRTVLKLGDMTVYLMDRNAVYDLFVVDMKEGKSDLSNSVILRAGYLVRNATLQNGFLELNGDVNRTTTVEVLGAPQTVTNISWNGRKLKASNSRTGTLVAKVEFQRPHINLPKLKDLTWRTADSLPEIQPDYNDASWTSASNPHTNNTTVRNLTTPTSLYGSDYGYNTGALLYRGHFTANGQETHASIFVQGGTGFASSLWLNSTFLGSYLGSGSVEGYSLSVSMPILKTGKPYVLTALIDQMGFDESGPIGSDTMKRPRGILDYNISGHAAKDITWKLTGNVGGEDYRDRVRGPLNEGGLYAERQGWQLPQPPSAHFTKGSPWEATRKPGVTFFSTSFNLSLPHGYDIPLSFVFSNSSHTKPAYRCLLFVNGWQFGKYVSYLGPQTSFPVPEGILNHHGQNWIALILWTLEVKDAVFEGLTLEATAIIQSGYGDVATVVSPSYSSVV